MKAIAQFYKSESDFQEIHHQLKQYVCPHCDQIGTLNLHGYLKGYDDKGYQNNKLRGHRIYCSNRARREGCGKTFSIMLYTLFKKYIITTDILWLYLKNISEGFNSLKAFDSLQSIFKTSTAYRLIKTIILNLPTLRTLLLNKHPPPKSSKISNPLIDTILHLQSAFAHHPNPLSAFQIHFQTSFL